MFQTSILFVFIFLSIIIGLTFVEALQCYSCSPCPRDGKVVNCSINEYNCLIAWGNVGLYTNVTLQKCAGKDVIDSPLDELTCRNYSTYTYNGLELNRVTACICGQDLCNAKGTSSTFYTPRKMYTNVFLVAFCLTYLNIDLHIK